MANSEQGVDERGSSCLYDDDQSGKAEQYEHNGNDPPRLVNTCEVKEVSDELSQMSKKAHGCAWNLCFDAASVEAEFCAPVPVLFPLGLILFEENAVLEHQNIHICSHETAISVFRGADDGFSPHIE